MGTGLERGGWFLIYMLPQERLWCSLALHLPLVQCDRKIIGRAKEKGKKKNIHM